MERVIKSCGLMVFLAMVPLFYPATTGAQLAKLSVGLMHFASVLPAYIAEEKGHFAQEGLEVKFTPLAGAPQIFEAMVGGSLDIGFGSALHVGMARDRGLKILIISSNEYSSSVADPKAPSGWKGPCGVMTRPDTGINGPRDLEGKKVAIISRYSLNWLATVEWMAKNGADPNKVAWIELAFPHQDKALRTGAVDVTVNAEPFVSMSLAQGGVKVLVHCFEAVRPYLILGTWNAAEPWLEKNATQAERFVRANRKGIDFANANPRESLAILTRIFKLPPEVARIVHGQLWKKDVDVEGVQLILDLALKWGAIKKRQAARDLLFRTAW